MCIINTSHNFVFIHIPKTAGTSISNALAMHCGVLDIELGGSPFGEAIQEAYMSRHHLRKHSTAQELCERIGVRRWATMVSFAVLRDPVERLASAYRFLKGWDSPANTEREQWLAYPSFRDFVASGLWERSDGPDRMFASQATWVEGAHGELLVQHLVPMTQLKQGLLKVLTHADSTVDWKASINSMEHLNQSEPETIVLDENSLRRLKQHYDADYQLLAKAESHPWWLSE